MTIKRKLLLSSGLATLLTVISILTPHKSYAFSTTVTITNRSPTVQSANIVGSGNTVEPWLAVGVGEYYGPYSYAKAYVPAGQTANLTIVRGGGYCGSTDVGSPNVTFTVYRLNSDESLGSSYSGGQVGSLSNGTGCGALTLSLHGAPKMSPTVIGHENYSEYYVEAHLNNFPGCRDPSCDTEKEFQLSTSNGLVGLAKNVIDYGALPGQSQFGVYMRDAPSKGGNNWDYALQYAPRCNQDNPPQPETVGIYDIDKGVAGYSQPNLSALVDKDNRADSTFNWGLAPAGGQYPVARPPFNTGNGTFNNLSYTSNYQNRYLLEFRDIDWHNTIQVQLPYDEFDALQSVGDECLNQVSCKVINPPENANIPPGQTTQVTIQTIDKNGSWLADGYSVKRFPNPAQAGYGPPVSGNGSQATVGIQPDASYSGQVTYTFGIYQNGNYTGNFCTVDYNVFNPNANLNISCTTTRAPPMSSSATYGSSTTISPGYWTAKKPDVNSNPFQYPHIWFNSAPPNNSSDITGQTPKPVAGQDYGVNPGIGGLVIWYYWVGVVQGNNPANIVPFYIHFVGSDGSVNDTQVYKAGVNTAFPFASTFGSFSFLRPHNTYTATLYAQTSGNLGANEQGPYGNPWTQIGSPQSLPQCLLAHLTGPFPNVCGGATGTDTVEIGSPVSFTYTLNLDNRTNVSFPNSIGYNVLLQPGSGVSVNPPNPVAVSIPSGPSVVPVPASFTVVLSNSGSYSIAFRYGGNILNNLGPDGWSGVCPGNPLNAVVKPYLQAFNGSVSAGGGFRSIGPNDTGTCGTLSDSLYISPTSGPAKGDQNSGGIEAFGRQSANRGSRTDFGALALGMIIGAPGGGGPNGDTGFYSGDQTAGTRPVFANYGFPGIFSSNMGGYSTSVPSNAISKTHCASDFYDNTQAGTPPTSTGSLSGDLTDCINNHNSRCQYSMPSGDTSVTGSDVTIPQGVQITIYSDHNVTINGNIRYGPFDATQQGNVPYFALIVKGNITVLGNGTTGISNVSQLDGLYIAQPVGRTANTGVFATCDDICNNQLVVNGAVIAQEVDLLRNHGTLSGNIDPQITGNPAEVFNFVPSMVIGQPAFKGQIGQPQGVFDLPPIF